MFQFELPVSFVRTCAWIKKRRRRGWNADSKRKNKFKANVIFNKRNTYTHTHTQTQKYIEKSRKSIKYTNTHRGKENIYKILLSATISKCARRARVWVSSTCDPRVCETFLGEPQTHNPPYQHPLPPWHAYICQSWPSVELRRRCQNKLQANQTNL